MFKPYILIKCHANGRDSNLTYIWKWFPLKTINTTNIESEEFQMEGNWMQPLTKQEKSKVNKPKNFFLLFTSRITWGISSYFKIVCLSK